MKKIIYMSFLVLLLIMVFVLIGNTNLIQLKEKLEYSTERPREDIISKMEVYNGVIEDVRKN